MESENNQDMSLLVWVMALHTNENHDMLGNQDPLVKVVILNREDESSEYRETASFNTPTQNLGGTDVTWDKINASFKVSEKQIKTDTLISFVAYDADWTSKEHIGETTPFNIGEIKTSGQQMPRKINIHDSEQQDNGWVQVSMQWEKPLCPDILKY